MIYYTFSIWITASKPCQVNIKVWIRANCVNCKFPRRFTKSSIGTVDKCDYSGYNVRDKMFFFLNLLSQMDNPALCAQFSSRVPYFFVPKSKRETAVIKVVISWRYNERPFTKNTERTELNFQWSFATLRNFRTRLSSFVPRFKMSNIQWHCNTIDQLLNPQTSTRQRWNKLLSNSVLCYRTCKIVRKKVNDLIWTK